jgi:hypothetical protein
VPSSLPEVRSELRRWRIEDMKKRTFKCSECGHLWRVEPGLPCPSVCPKCESDSVGLAPKDGGHGRQRSRSRAQRRGSRLYDDEQEDEFDVG